MPEGSEEKPKEEPKPIEEPKEDEPVTPIVIEEDVEYARQFYKNGLYILESSPGNIYTSNFGSTLHSKGVYGINGSFFINSGSNPNNAVTIMINNGKALVDNAQFNGWNSPPRPVLYYANGRLRYELAKSVNDLSTPISQITWGVGGGSLLPHMDSKEKWGTDVTRAGARRTGLAMKGNKVYLIATKIGMTLPEFGDRIKQAINPDYCLFLDGGGSTQFNYKGTNGIVSTRPVPNIIGVK